MRIYITNRALSDGTRVYTVHLGGVELNAASCADADMLCDKLAAAIDEHTVDGVDVGGLRNDA